MDPKKHLLAWGVTIALIVCGNQAFASSQLQQIEALFHQGKTKQAYDLAVEYLPEGEGDPEFDLLYGQLAIDNGKISHGIFALERVLLMQPNRHVARLEMARGYFLLGQQERAKAEFDRVLAANPPRAVREKVARYLSAITHRQSEYKTTARGYAKFGLGYDSNINSASSEKTFNTPTLGTGTFDDESLAQDAAFAKVVLGGRVTHPFAKGKYLFFGVDLEQKVNDGNDAYDLGSADFYGGYGMIAGKASVRVTAAAQHLQLDYRPYLDMYNVTAEGQYKLSPKKNLNGFVRLGAIEYSNLDNRDANTVTAGIGATVYTDWRFKPSFSAMVFGGIEDPYTHNATSKAIAEKESVGASLSSRLNINSRSTVDLSLLWQNTRYQGEDNVFLVKRADDYYKLAASYTRKLSEKWQLKLEASHSLLDSNISIYDYERDQVSGSVRYDF